MVWRTIQAWLPVVQCQIPEASQEENVIWERGKQWTIKEFILLAEHGAAWALQEKSISLLRYINHEIPGCWSISHKYLIDLLNASTNCANVSSLKVQRNGMNQSFGFLWELLTSSYKMNACEANCGKLTAIVTLSIDAVVESAHNVCTVDTLVSVNN